MSDETSKPTAPRQSLRASLTKIGHMLQRYAVVGFIVLLTGVYGFVLYRIQAAQTSQPSQSDIDSEVQATATPHVDQSVIDQIQSLQDHSVNVRTLFDQARRNPFNE